MPSSYAFLDHGLGMNHFQAAVLSRRTCGSVWAPYDEYRPSTQCSPSTKARARCFAWTYNDYGRCYAQDITIEAVYQAGNYCALSHKRTAAFILAQSSRRHEVMHAKGAIYDDTHPRFSADEALKMKK